MLRHGETAWNLERRMQGSKDSSLHHPAVANRPAAMGRARIAAELARASRARRSSCAAPLGRTRETALIVGRARSASIRPNGATIPGSPNLAMASGKARLGLKSRSIILMRWPTGVLIPKAFCPPRGETHFDLRRPLGGDAGRDRAVEDPHRRGEPRRSAGAVMRGLHLGLDARAMFRAGKSRKTRFFSACSTAARERILAAETTEATIGL